MPALLPFYPSLDQVPESVRSFYTMRDGRAVLEVSPLEGWALEDVNGLKATLSKVTQRLESAKGFLEGPLGFKLNEATGRFEGGLDPEEYRKAQARIAELEQIDPSKDADRLAEAKFNGLKAQWEAQRAAEVGKLQAEHRVLLKQLEDELTTNRAIMAIREKGGEPALLLPALRAETELRKRDDGRYEPVLRGPDGSPRISGQAGSTEVMSYLERVEEMRTQEPYMPAFSGLQRKGGDTRQVDVRDLKPGEKQQQGDEPAAVVDARDQRALNSNLEGLASGKTQVVGLSERSEAAA